MLEYVKVRDMSFDSNIFQLKNFNKDIIKTNQNTTYDRSTTTLSELNSHIQKSKLYKKYNYLPYRSDFVSETIPS